MNKFFLFALFWCCALLSNAQSSGDSQSPGMAGLFYEEGKIYVVITVVGIIFASLLLFLIYLERKLNKIEKNLGNK